MISSLTYLEVSLFQYIFMYNGLWVSSYYFKKLFLFYGHTCNIWKFLDHGLNLSHSCGNAALPLEGGHWTCTFAATQEAAVGFLIRCDTAGTPKAVFMRKVAVKLGPNDWRKKNPQLTIMVAGSPRVLA